MFIYGGGEERSFYKKGSEGRVEPISCWLAGSKAAECNFLNGWAAVASGTQLFMRHIPAKGRRETLRCIFSFLRGEGVDRNSFRQFYDAIALINNRVYMERAVL